VDILTRSNIAKSAFQYLEFFEQCFDEKELIAIKSENTEDSRYTHFFILWALKESYIKAIGLGLGFNLQDVRIYMYIYIRSCMYYVYNTVYKGYWS
jgi:phosphopantetheine--protein transferase-like protein